MGCYRVHYGSFGIVTYIKLLFKDHTGAYICDQYRISDRVVYSRAAHYKSFLFFDCKPCTQKEFDLIKEL